MSTLTLRFALDRGGFAMHAGLELPLNGVTALFGPSGSGKTTCLRVLAGLLRLPGATVSFGGTCWQDDAKGIFCPPHERPLGVVFQEASLFDHLSVADNLAYGQARRGGKRDQKALLAMAERLGINALLARRPAHLSGGERQRVAIARALLARPRLLLMDEPLAALDLRRRQEILPYLERLRAELEIPVVYVSHAPDEVARLADHLVLLDQGHVVASGPLTETLARLDLPATFADDAGVVIEMRLGQAEPDSLSRLDFAGGTLLVGQRPEAEGTRLRCRIHASDVSVALARPQGSSILNALPATVAALANTDRPGHMLVRLMLGPTPVLARLTTRSVRELGLCEGQPVWAQIKAVALLA